MIALSLRVLGNVGRDINGWGKKNAGLDDVFGGGRLKYSLSVLRARNGIGSGMDGNRGVDQGAAGVPLNAAGFWSAVDVEPSEERPEPPALSDCWSLCATP